MSCPSSVLSQLRLGSKNYREMLEKEMRTRIDRDQSYSQIASIDEAFKFDSCVRLFELRKDRTLVLVEHKEEHPSTDVGEEFIVKVQGFLLHMSLPPVRPFQLPRNPNRLIDMRQSVTVTGLGCEAFEKAVAGLSILYQTVKAKIMQRGGQLRDWTPVNLGDDEGNTTLTFGSRYLTAAKDVGNDDIRPDLAEVIDPFNILRPLLRTEVHTLDNCVQYWQRMPKTSE
ncbi:hypothetical protein L226DRAFT_577112 [Lentinus tigrinus ALCF2SS1-7]|uniref:uncharacterized protein n=1 Tax=Lentinus tigrinus ALCF2SS1-7 TaxID=1328758 RepID=UPI0011661688|nr:hypothetical protein L226DRAFT_577112 [Lentinus tigrinus ALCF2SS1-7]